MTAATAAAVHAAMIRQEEEDMTRYEPQDLSQWEFKILRSTLGEFRKPATLQRVIQEESQGGWELLEKFDDSRIRFRRPLSTRQQDGSRPLGYDPYRTTYGMSEGASVFWVLGAIAVFFVAFFGILFALGLI